MIGQQQSLVAVILVSGHRVLGKQAQVVLGFWWHSETWDIIGSIPYKQPCELQGEKNLAGWVIRLETSLAPPRATGRLPNICILNDRSHPGRRSQQTQQCSFLHPYGLLISSSHPCVVCQPVMALFITRHHTNDPWVLQLCPVTFHLNSYLSWLNWAKLMVG